MTASLPPTVYRIDPEAKKAQLKADGRYPWKFAIDHLRYSTEPHLSRDQASDLLYQISGCLAKKEEMAKHLADIRIDNIILEMRDRCLRNFFRETGIGDSLRERLGLPPR
jgi:hypothetical protein